MTDIKRFRREVRLSKNRAKKIQRLSGKILLFHRCLRNKMCNTIIALALVGYEVIIVN